MLRVDVVVLWWLLVLLVLMLLVLMLELLELVMGLLRVGSNVGVLFGGGR